MNKPHELMTNEFDNIRTQLNDFMIAIKINQSDKTDEKYIEARKRYSLPTPEQCDILHHKLIEIINKFDKPIKKRYY